MLSEHSNRLAHRLDLAAGLKSAGGDVVLLELEAEAVGPALGNQNTSGARLSTQPGGNQ